MREARADESPPDAPGAVAVVELFTSEGCSSCPPADAVLADLARARDRHVFALAFHVDYWNALGWADRFASPEATARQRAYARSLGTRAVYTPQMIVGGTEEFTGSDRDRADVAVARALAHPANVRLSVLARRDGPDMVSVDFVATGAPAGAVLDVAVVEHRASTSVRSGENAGKRLLHANVVRAFTAIPLAAARGSVRVPLPRVIARQDAEVIAYVQSTPPAGGGMPVLGAASAPLP
jgi:hypothetical protein